MEENAFDLREGMEVIASDGAKIGTVSHVYAGAPLETLDTPASGAGQVMPGSYATPLNPDAGHPTTPDLQAVQTVETIQEIAPGVVEDDVLIEAARVAPPPARADFGATASYFQVHHGGVLGLGGENLYIPFSAIADLDDGGAVTLRCTSDECTSLYNQPPDTILAAP